MCQTGFGHRLGTCPIYLGAFPYKLFFFLPRPFPFLWVQVCCLRRRAISSTDLVGASMFFGGAQHPPISRTPTECNTTMFTTRPGACLFVGTVRHTPQGPSSEEAEQSMHGQLSHCKQASNHCACVRSSACSHRTISATGHAALGGAAIAGRSRRTHNPDSPARWGHPQHGTLQHLPRLRTPRMDLLCTFLSHSLFPLPSHCPPHLPPHVLLLAHSPASVPAFSLPTLAAIFLPMSSLHLQNSLH